ncbi:MAG TPA: hypothetical protein DCQ29_02030, partial [Chitinophagaceae bacterium]|nr:hypothetical protein [Chitinophagaceae bacterium]
MERLSENKRKFQNALEFLARTYGIRQIFTDLLDTLLYPLIIDDSGALARNPLPQYKPNEIEIFQQMMLEVGTIMDDDGTGLNDALGDLFMEFLSFGKNGQFFTPQCICDMMAAMQGEMEDGQSVCDCACGSGRMLLAAAKRNRNLRFYGSDLDITCVKMTAINLAMNSLKGEVAWMNTITMEHYGSFKIHRCPFTRVPFITTLPKGTSDMVVRIKNTIEKAPIQEVPNQPIIIQQQQQLTL